MWQAAPHIQQRPAGSGSCDLVNKSPIFTPLPSFFFFFFYILLTPEEKCFFKCSQTLVSTSNLCLCKCYICVVQKQQSKKKKKDQTPFKRIDESHSPSSVSLSTQVHLSLNKMQSVLFFFALSCFSVGRCHFHFLHVAIFLPPEAKVIQFFVRMVDK